VAFGAEVITLTGDDPVVPASRQAAQVPQHPSRRAGAGILPASAEIASRDAIRRGVQRAIGCAGEMAEAARTGDPIGLSISGFELARVLQELWSLRDRREENWGDLLNILQGALAREEFETFAEDRCKLIGQVLADHLRPWKVEDEDLRSAIRLLRLAGLDPWKGLSGAEGG
jgi:hypothetical protein